MKPKISILMAVFNGAATLKEAIDSILSQTFKDFEFIIINDGSTDDTLSIIESYQDTRIRVINNKINLIFVHLKSDFLILVEYHMLFNKFNKGLKNL